ncbi:MAG: zf-HC2 domain-containing protein, partial [Candidatus Dormibacteraeota bacterium]|nr:zf-HC2 domain-containing protein [Candidatus Dormibacteraeota bacterium]
MKKCQPRLLTPYHDGELTRDARGEVEEHLQSCPSCGAMLDEVVVASQKVRSMGRAAVPLSALVPAVEVFAERAGLELGAPSLSDTFELAREPARVVAPVPPALPALVGAFDTDSDVEPGATTASEPGALDVVPAATAEDKPEVSPAPAIDPPLARVPPPIPRPTTAASPGIGLADDDESVDLAPPVMRGIEPMAAPPPSDIHEAEQEDAEDHDAAEETEEPEQMELATPAEPVDFHAQAPLPELRPPWLGESEVEDQSLEAEGRAAVDDVIERETATEGEGTADGSQGTEAAAAGEDLDETPERDLTPLDPIPDPGPPAPRPEPRLEPPPEPWTTVWRPSKGVEPELPVAEPEPPAEIEPAAEFEPPAEIKPAAARRFEIKDQAEPEPSARTEHDVEPTHGLETHALDGSDQPLPEVEEAIARLRGDLRQGMAEPGLLMPEEETVETFESLSDFQTELQRGEKRRPVILGVDLGKPTNQVRVGAAAVVVLVLVLAGTALA